MFFGALYVNGRRQPASQSLLTYTHPSYWYAALLQQEDAGVDLLHRLELGFVSQLRRVTERLGTDEKTIFHSNGKGRRAGPV